MVRVATCGYPMLPDATSDSPWLSGYPRSTHRSSEREICTPLEVKARLILPQGSLHLYQCQVGEHGGLAKLVLIEPDSS